MTYAKATGLAALDGVEIGVLGLLAGAAHRRGLLNPGVSGVLGLLALAASAPASVHSPSPVARSVTSNWPASSPRRSLRVPGTATRSGITSSQVALERVAKIRLPLRGERQTCCEPASHHFARGGIRLGGRCRIRAAHGRPVECGHRCPRRPCVRGGIAQAGREGEEVGRAPSADRGGRADRRRLYVRALCSAKIDQVAKVASGFRRGGALTAARALRQHELDLRAVEAKTVDDPTTERFARDRRAGPRAVCRRVPEVRTAEDNLARARAARPEAT